ncbi:MAG: hypothetical protein KDC71_24450, partial [Acidobacteria bacterium]|nr:hypothetical protein [Acidobacteriota bacterium]
AWATQKRFPHYSLFPMNYGDPVPAELGESVWIVDFSLPFTELQAIALAGKKIFLLDHHESAYRRIKDWKHPNAQITLDMTQSGAGLAWRTHFPDEKTPKFIRYIEDRDLWQFKLPFSRAISYWMFAEVQTIQDLDTLLEAFEDAASFQAILGQAQVLEDYVKKQVATIVRTAKPVQLHGVDGLAVHTPILQSEVGEALAQQAGMGVLFSEGEQGYKISLRSCGSLNVAQLAEYYGGGGHPRAAGFSTKTLPWA